MKFKGIGYRAPLGSSPQELTENLETLIDCGYDYVEVAPDNWRMWVGGRVDQRRLKQLVAVLDVFSAIDFPQKPVFMLETLVFDQRDGGPARMFQEAKRLAGLRG